MAEEAIPRLLIAEFSSDRRAAASPFAAMTGLDRDTSRDRPTGQVCAVQVEVRPLLCGMVTGPGFSSRNQSDQERTTAYRDGAAPGLHSDIHCATNVGDWKEPSGNPGKMLGSASG